MLPIAGEVALVEQGVAEPPRVWSSARSSARKRRSSKSSASTSGPSAARRRSKRVRALGHQLEHRSVELDDLVLVGADHEPGAPRAPPPALAAPVDAPLSRHAQVRVQRQVALEADEQVLAARVDRAHGAPVEPLGPAIHRVARLRRLDRDDRLADQRGAHAAGGGVDRVALGHATKSRGETRLEQGGRAASTSAAVAGDRRAFDTSRRPCAPGMASAGTACGRARAGIRWSRPAFRTAETTSPSGCSHSSVRLCTVCASRSA